jgi:hypothetical protein
MCRRQYSQRSADSRPCRAMALARPVRLSLLGVLGVRVARYRLGAGRPVSKFFGVCRRSAGLVRSVIRPRGACVPSLRTPFRSFGLRPSAARIVGAIWVGGLILARRRSGLRRNRRPRAAMFGETGAAGADHPVVRYGDESGGCFRMGRYRAGSATCGPATPGYAGWRRWPLARAALMWHRRVGQPCSIRSTGV